MFRPNLDLTSHILLQNSIDTSPTTKISIIYNDVFIRIQRHSHPPPQEGQDGRSTSSLRFYSTFMLWLILITISGRRPPRRSLKVRPCQRARNAEVRGQSRA